MNIKDFKEPGSLYRPAPFWSWNDKLEKAELERQIEEMADKGWGGYFMHSRVGLVTSYLSEEWMELVKACAEKARETDTLAWLYDEDRWPSGFASGVVPALKEEYRQRVLILLKEEQLTEDDQILKEVDLDYGKYFICKRVLSLGSRWFNGKSYVDLMNPKMVKSFFETTHEKYKKECGKYFGKEIPGIFTDEPNYLMDDPSRRFADPVLPWSEYLPAFFEKLKDYSLEEHLLELFFEQGNYHKIRYDFFDSATRLFVDSFTKQYYQWCDENNLILTGHLLAEDDLILQTRHIGAAMPHYEHMHWPGIDKLCRDIKGIMTVKQLSSVSDQLGKERNFCEIFGASGQQVSFYHRKWIADWAAVLGINVFNHHLSLYSMRGERKRDYPPNFFYQQPWWEEEKGFSDYLGRLSEVVASGQRDVEVLIIHPIASVWSEYSPIDFADNCALERAYYNRPFEKLSRYLLAENIDFHYGDEILMEKWAEVVDGKLKIGKYSYSTVIVPPALTLNQNTVNLLQELKQNGNKDNLILIQPTPGRIDGEEKELTISQSRIVESISDCLNLLKNKYQDRIKTIDQMTSQNAAAIICQQRIVDNEELILLVNTDQEKEINTKISITNQKNPLVLDLISGKIYEPLYQQNGAAIELNLKFYPAGSLLLLFSEESYASNKIPLTLDTGVEFSSKSLAGKIQKEQLIIAAKDWQLSFAENNVLPLNKATLSIDGQQVLENETLAKAWHYHFYPAPEGTPFQAEYHFEVINKPAGEMTAVIEMAENLEQITLNGVELKALKKQGENAIFDVEKSWLDPSFSRVPLKDAVQEGDNKLVISGKKFNNITGHDCHLPVENVIEHQPTEVEAVYILGDFTVENIDNTLFKIDGSKKQFLSGEDLKKNGYSFYTGKVEYKAKIASAALPEQKKLFFKVNNVAAACITLYINGEKIGTKYWAPYIYDLSDFIQNGENEIKIIAANTLFNLMGPNWIVDSKEDTGISPYDFTNLNKYTEKYRFFPFGIGDISIIDI